MLSRFLRTALMGATLTVLGAGVASAQTPPSPAPSPATTTTDRTGGAPAGATATPAPGWNPLNVKGLTISGTLRAYDVNRINTPEYNSLTGAPTGPNRAAFNFGGVLRADYKIGDTPFSVGGALWGAYPFGVNGGSVGCNVGGGLIVHEPQALCSKNNAGIDNTLPGFPLETFEYYVKYTDKVAAITVGDQLLNKLWEPSSDSRIKPALYQAADATINVTKALSIGLTRITRFENRSESSFDECTLITCTTTAVNGIGSIVGFRSATTGADRVALAFKPTSRFTVNTEVYRFHNIGNLTYFDSKYYVTPKNDLNPYFGFQFVNETQAGTAIVHRVQNQTIGLQLGVTPVKNFLFTVGADQIPWNYATIAATSSTAASTIAAANYLLPAGGTTAVSPKIAGTADLYKVAYGGIASPYTDSYTSDPLYTTSISQGMVERRSGGFSLKGALTYTAPDKKFVAIVSEAAYNYDTSFARNRTYELDGDVTFNFNKVRAGTYKGLSLRERLADRTQATLPFNFVYVRHQLQYSF